MCVFQAPNTQSQYNNPVAQMHGTYNTAAGLAPPVYSSLLVGSDTGTIYGTPGIILDTFLNFTSLSFLYVIVLS